MYTAPLQPETAPHESQLVRGLRELTEAARIGSTGGIITVLSSLLNGWAVLIDRYGTPVAHVGAARVHIDTAIAIAAGIRPSRDANTVQVFAVGHPLEPKARLVTSERLGSRGLGRELSRHAASLIDLTFGAAVHPRLDAIARADAVDTLTCADAALARRTAERWGFQGDRAVVAIVQSGSRSVVLEPHVLGWMRELTIAPCAVTVGRSVTVVLDPVTVSAWMDRVTTAADAGLPVRCGVGDAALWGSLVHSGHRAELCLDVASTRGLAAVAFDELSLATSVLDGLGARARSALDVPIGLLRAADPSGSLEVSARTYLATNGSTEASASALGIHRHTLRARVARIEDVTGLDLTDADDRATLWLALRSSSAT